MDRTIRGLVRQAINECDCPRRQKFAVKLLLAVNPRAREEIQQECISYINEVAAAGIPAGSFDAGIDPENFEKWLQILIEYLPQLIEIIMKLFAS